jgi:hypothetical protein
MPVHAAWQDHPLAKGEQMGRSQPLQEKRQPYLLAPDIGVRLEPHQPNTARCAIDRIRMWVKQGHSMKVGQQRRTELCREFVTQSVRRFCPLGEVQHNV